MPDDAPAAVPLAYDAAPPRRDAFVAVAAFAVSVLCLTLPAFMACEACFRGRRSWPVYSPYGLGGIDVSGVDIVGPINIYANTAWFAVDTVALLMGVVGIYLGRPRFGLAAVVVSVVAMTAVMTFVLGSPW